MANNNHISSVGTGTVTSLTPDVCKTPPSMKEVPYTITAKMNIMKSTVTRVKERNRDVVNFYTSIVTVKGDEPGTGGGVISKVNLGVCYPLTHCASVRAGKAWVIRHTSEFGMNAKDEKSPYNTKGKLTIIKVRGVTLDTSADQKKFDQEYDKLVKKHPATTLTDQDFDKVAKELRCERNTIKAIAREETFGEDGFAGFWRGRAKLLWEPKHFQQNFLRDFPNSPAALAEQQGLAAGGTVVTQQQLAQMYVDNWRTTYGAGFIGGGPQGTWTQNLERFDRGMELAPGSAAKSASFGLFQMMWQSVDGKTLGGKKLFNSAGDFVNAMNASELSQLNVFSQYVQATPGLQTAMQTNNWAEIARIHNGSAYTQASRYRTMADGVSRNYAERIQMHKEDLDAEDKVSAEADGIVVPRK